MMMHGRNEMVATIILAAGKGTRMRSDLAKVLHPVCGKPMVFYPVEIARNVGSELIVLVVGHQADVVRRSVYGDDLVFVDQREQLGTGHAVLQTKGALEHFNGTILILCGDVPLLLPSTVESFLASHVSSHATVTVMTTLLDDPTGYGRVVKRSDNTVHRIVEDRDASADEKKIREINSGIYCADSEFLFRAVAQIGNENAQGEFYLTDIFAIATEMNCHTHSFVIPDPLEVMGINTVRDLEKADEIMRERLNS